MLYEELLAKAKLDSDKVNFAELRESYLQSDSYQPYFRDNDENIKSDLFAAIKNKDYVLACKTIDNLLEINYLNIEIHMKAYEVWREIGFLEKAEYHAKFVEKLLNLIYESGDGRSYETAFVITDVHEEYVILHLYGVKVLSQMLSEHNGYEYDIITCLNPKTGGQGKIYFNINIPTRWLKEYIQRTLPEELNF